MWKHEYLVYFMVYFIDFTLFYFLQNVFYDNEHRKVVLPIRSSIDLVLDFTQDSRWCGYCTEKQK